MSSVRRIGEILAEARALAPAERTAFLDHECVDDAMRAEVESLLAASDTMGGFLDRPVSERLAHKERELETGARVGRYEVERRLGAGASGAVYAALQEQPHRRVALKVMRTGAFSERALRRFLDEAEILARLTHPGIAHVYEAGVHEERPFLALEFVEGARTLLEYAASEHLDRRRRLELFASLCDAVHHGHQKGVIHRDVKPGNVLVGAAGLPKLIDFGIARAGDGPTGELVGTPPYMSPEQCEPGADIDLRADVYSLGVLCQELLTGKTPHRVTGVPVSEAMRRLRDEEPTLASEIDRSLRGDVEAILVKATHRDREQRYPSASALAADVRRHLRSFPVEAREGGVLYQVACFARRQRGVFLAVCAVVVISIVAAIVNRSLAVENARERQAAEWQATLANLSAATAALRVYDPSEAKQRLAAVPEKFRNWEWDHLSGRVDRSAEWVVAGAHCWRGTTTRDGKWMAALGRSIPPVKSWNAVFLWNRETGEKTTLLQGNKMHRRDSIALHPHEPWVAIGYASGRVEIRHRETADIVHRFAAHTDTVIDLCYAADGLLATASRDGTIQLWRGGTRLRTLRGHTDRVICVAFSDDALSLASGGREGVIRVWDVASGVCRHVLEGHESSVEGVSFSPDGARLASASRDQTVRLWDVESERLLTTRHAHTSNVRDITFTPDGAAFVSGSWDGTLRVWAADDGRELGCLYGHEGQIVELAVDATAQRVVSFSYDGTVRFWDWTRVEDERTLRGHADTVLRVAFVGPDRLVSTSHDETVRLWDAHKGVELDVLKGWARPTCLVALDKQRFMTAYASTLRIWTAGDPEPRDRNVPYGVVGAAWDPGRRWLYLASWKKSIILETDTMSMVGVLDTHTRVPTAIAVHPAGHRVFISSREGRLTNYDPQTRREQTARTIEASIHDLACSETLGAAACADATIRLFDSQTLESRGVLRGHAAAVYAVAFSPDGTRLASGGFDRTVRLWDVRSGQQVAVLRGHRFKVHDVAFSPDGNRLVSCDGSTEDVMSAIKIWDRYPGRR